MEEVKVLALLESINEKLEENNNLLDDVVVKLDKIKSELSSVTNNTGDTYYVKNAVEEVLDFLKEKL